MLAQQIAAMHPHSLVRIEVDWGSMQPKCSTIGASGCLGPGPIYWGYLDSLMASLRKYGLRMLGTIDTSPRWTWDLTECTSATSSCSDDPGSWPHPPADTPTALDYLRQFLVALIQRYDSGYPGQFAGLEVWNEENVQTWWKTSAGPDPARYTRMLCTAYRAVKSVNPSIPVVFGGLGNVIATNTFKGNIYMGVGDFLDGTYNAGAAGCMTDMSIHPYTSNLEPPDGPHSVFLTALSNVRAAEAAHGDTGRPLWITEFGYYTGCQSSLPWCEPVSWQDQANFLECAYQLVAGMPDVQVLLIIAMYDSPAPGSSQSTQEYWGIFQDPGTAKPASSMFTNLFRSFGDRVPPVTSCSQTHRWGS
jgi:hypothetical protein